MTLPNCANVAPARNLLNQLAASTSSVWLRCVEAAATATWAAFAPETTTPPATAVSEAGAGGAPTAGVSCLVGSGEGLGALNGNPKSSPTRPPAKRAAPAHKHAPGQRSEAETSTAMPR